MATDSLAAAGLCLRQSHYRSAVSRAYYAAFSAVTAALLRTGLRAPPGRETWAHARLPVLAQGGLEARLGRIRAKDVVRILRTTYDIRVMADYQSGISVDEETARRCVSAASSVLRALGVGDA